MQTSCLSSVRGPGRLGVHRASTSRRPATLAPLPAAPGHQQHRAGRGRRLGAAWVAATVGLHRRRRRRCRRHCRRRRLPLPPTAPQQAAALVLSSAPACAAPALPPMEPSPRPSLLWLPAATRISPAIPRLACRHPYFPAAGRARRPHQAAGRRGRRPGAPPAPPRRRSRRGRSAHRQLPVGVHWGGFWMGGGQWVRAGYALD